jgi:hypothetical protein
MQGSLIQVLNLLIGFVPILAVILCRVYFPNKFWVGMVLSVLSFPIGHFYIRKGIGYVVITLLFTLLIYSQIKNVIVIVPAGCSVSAVLMLLRFKMKSIKLIEQNS